MPFRLPILKGTEERSSTDHMEVQPSDRDFGPTIKPASHVQRRVSPFFLPRVDSNQHVKLGITFHAHHQQREQAGTNVSVDIGND